MPHDAFTDARESRWELQALAGRAVLVGSRGRQERDPAGLGLPAALVSDLHEWAQVVDTVGQDGRPTGEAAAEVISQRGRQLAMRVALETGGEIGYRDPASGELRRVGRRRTSRPVEQEVPPTPWATGLTVSAAFAAIVVIALTVVTFGLAEVNPLLAGLVNIGVAAGFAPSIWLGRNIEVWRWVALGTAAGIVLAWVVLLLSVLG
ncbi:DUF2537 domain-containing protein [Parasphingorhabdus pacifica]